MTEVRRSLVFGRGGPPAEVEAGDRPRVVPAWWKGGADPALDGVRHLYCDEGLDLADVARRLAVSRPRVAAAIAETGIERPRPRKHCPLSAAELDAFMAAGNSAQALARRGGVSGATARRWLADVGLLPPDSEVDPVRLRELYVHRQLSTRAIAAELGVNRQRVVAGLAAAGIPARPRSQRSRSGKFAGITDDALRVVYAQPGMTVEAAARHFGVGTEHLRRRLHEVGLLKRPGTFTPHLDADRRAALRDRAPQLYAQGLTSHEVASELGVSASSVLELLHDARVPVRARGARGAEPKARVLVDDLYADPAITAALRRHRVHQPTLEQWRPAGPLESYAPLPLSAALLRALYCDIGLSSYHIALLCGVGKLTVQSRLTAVGIPARPGYRQSPWSQRSR